MATDFFLKLDGIQGESQDGSHKNEIDISSWSWGISQSGGQHTGGGGGQGKANVHDINISKVIDKSSTALMNHCVTGKHIASGLITCRKAGEKPQEYLKITLTDVIITSLQLAGHGAEVVGESVSLNFAKYKVEYAQQDAKGNVTPAGSASFDIKQNKVV